MNRWLVEYENIANPHFLLDAATAIGIQIVGVYPDAFCFIVEAPEKTLMKWVATLSVKRIITAPFSDDEMLKEENPHLKQLMSQWNLYLSTFTTSKHPHEGLSWDHPGFLPPGKP